MRLAAILLVIYHVFLCTPIQVRVQSIGAHVATVTWQPPPEGSRNGELILYRINISCEDWLRPRQIDVLNSMSQLIRGMLDSILILLRF